MTALLAAACAGVAVWFSIGILALSVSEAGQLVRIGLLPPIWLLPVLILVCVAAARVGRLPLAAALPLFCSLILILPWIPGAVPPAFLIWSGPVTACVWVGIVVAVLVGWGGSRGPHFDRSTGWVRDPRRAPRAAALVACVLYIASAWWLAGILPGGDEPHYLIITQSLLKDGDLRIENNHARRDYSEYFGGELRPDFLRRGTNGQIYSIHAPGLSAVIAPAYALHGYHGVVVFLSIAAAIGGALIWSAAFGLTGSVAAGWFTWAAWALTVPFFFQAFSVFPDGLGATMVLFAALPLFADAGGQPHAITRRRWFGTGVVLALLPWLHTRFAIIAAVLGICLLLRLIRTVEGRSNLLAFLGVPVVSAIAWFAFFRAIYGTFSPAAPYNGYTQSSLSNILTGLPALFFDQQFGILPYAPVFGFGVVGMVALARRHSRLASEVSIITLCYLLSSSAYHMWWGGSSAPARFAVPVLPLLILPAGWLWASARHNATRTLGFALLVVSVGITASTITVDGGQLGYNFRDGYSRFAEWLNPAVDLPRALPSFFRQTSDAALLRATVWVTSMLLVWLGLAYAVPRRWLAAATILGLALGVMLSVAIVWKLEKVTGLSADTSQLNLLEHFDPHLRPAGVDLAAMAFVTPDALMSRLSISTPQRRSLSPSSTLLLVPGVVPAGTYSLLVSPPSPSAGTARLVIGRNAKPILSWKMPADLRDGSVQFELPVNVGSVVIQGDEEAVREIRTLSLRPVHVTPPADQRASGYARRVERYGPGLVYFFDDGAFVEDPGFWVRGGAATQIAVMPRETGTPMQLFVRNAPVINQVEIAMDGRLQTFTLQPREERTMPVSFSDHSRAASVTIRSSSGFRPSSVDAGSTDTRFLGVWIELR